MLKAQPQSKGGWRGAAPPYVAHICILRHAASLELVAAVRIATSASDTAAWV